MVTFKTSPVTDSRSTIIMAEFDNQMMFNRAMEIALVREIVRGVAEKYIEANYQSIVARSSQDAIATLTVAEVAAKLRETLERDIASRINDTQNPISSENHETGKRGT